MSIIKLKQKTKRVEIGSFELENEIVFSFFNKLPEAQRDEYLQRSIYIGVLALMEDRFSSFLSKTSNELGVQLESLKMIFDMKKEVFFKTAVKGLLAETEIADFLHGYVSAKSYKDTISLTGTEKGKLPKNKTGDILCELTGHEGKRIVVECKFDKSVKLGEPSNRDIFLNKTDTAWSQLLEAQVNRESEIAIIVFDVSVVDHQILKVIENVGYIPNLGFIVIIDSQKSDYTNLSIAYSLSREILLSASSKSLDATVLNTFIGRMLKNLEEISSIKILVERNVETNQQILKQIEKSMLMTKFFHDYLTKYIRDGKLDKGDLLDFYFADDIRAKYKVLEKEIDSLMKE